MPPWAFPSPLQVVIAFYELTASGELLEQHRPSVLRQFTGVHPRRVSAFRSAGAGCFAHCARGVPSAMPAYLSDPRHCLDSSGDPLVWHWLQIDRFVIFFSGIWPIIFNTMAGVQTLSGQYTDVARVYLASRSLYTRRILIPGSLPFIITGIRLTYGVGWRVIVGAEMISSIVGLGFLIDDARWQLRPDIMVCGMITIAMIGWVSENWFSTGSRSIRSRSGV